jgi:undecaprenyl-diphosphatase
MFSVFKNINRFVGKSKTLDYSAIFLARFLPYLLVVFLFLYSLRARDINLFVFPVISGVLARLLNEVVHIFYKEQRPASLSEAKVIIPVPKSLSMPSGHASFFFAMSFMTFFYNIPLAVIFIICSCLIGIARVFCGVHWFRDIIAGTVMGFISSLIVLGLVNLL